MKAYMTRRYAVDILLPCPQTQRTMVGVWIHRTIGKGLLNTGPDALPIRTFRVIRGNGFAGTVAGERIQHQFDRVIPSSINNPEGAASRTKFAAAVAAWQTLDVATKKSLDAEQTRKGLHMTGFNLYIRRAMLDLL